MVSRRAVLGVAGGVAVAGVAVAAGEYALEAARDVEPAAPPAVDARGRLLWRNWSGIAQAYPAARAAPRNEDELVAVVKGAVSPVRAVGAGHSFTPLVPTDGTLVSLDNFSGVSGHDAGLLQASVKSGTRLGALGEMLAGVGQEMFAQPDINKQALGGALATGTHGTGALQPALHGGVVAFRMVTAKGEVLTASAAQNAEIFNAARVGLGAFGILTEVTLQNRKLSRIRKRTELVKTGAALERWPELKKAHRTVEIYVLPFTGMSAIIASDPTDDAVLPRGADHENEVLLELKALRDYCALAPWLRRFLAARAMAGVPPVVAVDDGYKLLSNERPVRFNEMEYHLPAEVQAAAAAEVLAVVERHRPDVFFPFELRCIATDDAWLSPFYQRASGSVAVHAYYQNDYAFLFDLVEPILRRYGGRPHWGKLNSLRARDFAALYPRFRDAAEVRQSLDPEGKFMNDYLRRVLLDV
jgi:FAD-linked oxidoreductase